MYKEILCNMANLRDGYRLAHRSKTNSPDVIEFDKNKLYNLNIILKQLENKEWDKIFKYYRFMIHYPKDRIVDAMVFEGRIVQHVLCDKILRPYFEPRLVKENCACRIGKGTDFAAMLIKQGLTKYLRTHDTGYVLKIDVKQYFPSIDRTILKDILKDFPDDEIKELLYYIINHCPEENGLPIGNQTSQWFALYYMNALDRIIKEKYRIKIYARYMDDFIIVHEDKELLTRLLSDLKSFAWNSRHLRFNNKTQIYPIRKGFSFLGWRYVVKNKKIIKRVDNGKLRYTITKIKETKNDGDRFRSLCVYLSRGITYKFINHYLTKENC